MSRCVFEVLVRPGLGRINGRAVLQQRRGGKRAIGKSDAYRSYCAEVSFAAAAQLGQVGCFRGGLLGVAVTFYVESVRHLEAIPEGFLLADLDVDASIKATLDGLQQGGLLDDDARVVELHARKRVDKARPRVAVAVCRVPAE